MSAGSGPVEEMTAAAEAMDADTSKGATAIASLSEAGCSKGDEEPSFQQRQEEERAAAEKVINAMLFYRHYGKKKIRDMYVAFQALPTEHQKLLTPVFPHHILRMKRCVEENYKVMKEILVHGAGCEDVESATRVQPASEHYMSKVRSTLKQIVREWSSEGSAERETCYGVVRKALLARYPKADQRHAVRVLVPGAGLGRLPCDLVLDGFSVQGAEFSFLMLFTSYFIINYCRKKNEYTIYPYVLDSSNNWSYEDQLRPVQFPDFCSDMVNEERKNTFSMCAGEFCEATREESESWDAVVTVFFIDTAANLLDYIDNVWRILKRGGVWLNFGPLTYHYAESEDERSIELPYEEVIRLVKAKGFSMERDERRDANHTSIYASNEKSMLRYQYNCGFFECVKL